NLGVQTAPCNLRLGMTYDEFTNLCVRVTSDGTANDTATNMLLGGITHSTERWSFDVQGVDLNFQSGSLPPNDILHDKDLPQKTDVAVNFDVDQSTLGRILNDRAGNSIMNGKDLHGSGLVYLEYARGVQDALNSYLPASQQHPLGDPACLYDPVAKT